MHSKSTNSSSAEGSMSSNSISSASTSSSSSIADSRSDTGSSSSTFNDKDSSGPSSRSSSSSSFSIDNDSSTESSSMTDFSSNSSSNGSGNSNGNCDSSSSIEGSSGLDGSSSSAGSNSESNRSGGDGETSSSSSRVTISRRLRYPEQEGFEVVGTVELSFNKAARPTFPTLNPTRPNSAYLCNMAVAQNLRRQGIGLALLETAERLSLERGSSSVSLHCRLCDVGPNRLYRQQGYEVEAEDTLVAAVLFLQRRRQLMAKGLRGPLGVGEDEEERKEGEGGELSAFSALGGLFKKVLEKSGPLHRGGR
eukprot:TRINITY_DN1235_c6_g1_i1.p1 TRINITY_DN1235_c6_g1~~TRINITY_DN1235_c6_g1_i1.p1  ORF type:complete len:308 (-),score=107.35 TRINITY_DN1235_c6_g1_i1:692-1615(-)